MQLFFNSNIDLDTRQVTFDKIESKHIVRVLRKKEGDPIFITDGKGVLFHCQITSANDKKCIVSIHHQEKKDPFKEYYLHVAIAPTKNMGRLEWFLEKATEIGIHEITPIISEHTEKSNLNIDRSNKLLISAMKQSLRSRLPILNTPTSFEDYVNQKKCAENNFIASCKKNNYSLLEEKLIKDSSANVLIGPEGGFSNNELNFAKNTNFMPISLGNYRYRTETAGISVCMIFSLINK